MISSWKDMNPAVKTIIYTIAAHIPASFATRSRVSIVLPPSDRGQHRTAPRAAWRTLCSAAAALQQRASDADPPHSRNGGLSSVTPADDRGLET